MDVDRLRKMLGMLGSDQPGERSAAALKATELLRDAGMSWADVSVKQPTDESPNALLQALEEMQSLKSALAGEMTRNRILSGQIDVMRRANAQAAQAKADEDAAAEAKKPRAFWRPYPSTRAKGVPIAK